MRSKFGVVCRRPLSESPISRLFDPPRLPVNRAASPSESAHYDAAVDAQDLPLMNPASSESRNDTTAARSSGHPRRGGGGAHTIHLFLSHRLLHYIRQYRSRRYDIGSDSLATPAHCHMAV